MSDIPSFQFLLLASETNSSINVVLCGGARHRHVIATFGVVTTTTAARRHHQSARKGTHRQVQSGCQLTFDIP